MIGEHTVTLTPTSGAPVDLSCLVDQVAIHYGRDDSDSQPEANAATLDLSTDSTLDPFPTALEVGGTITVTTTLPGRRRPSRPGLWEGHRPLTGGGTMPAPRPLIGWWHR